MYNRRRRLFISLLPPANEVCEGYVFTPVCQSFCSWGEYLGRYTSSGQVHSSKAGTPPRQVHPQAGTHTPRQVHPLGRYTPWADAPRQVHPQAGTPPWAGTPHGQVNPHHSACWDTVNKRAVRIPLECILVTTLVVLTDFDRFN